VCAKLKKLLGSTAYRHKCLAIFSLIFKEILTPEYQSFRIFRKRLTKARLCETQKYKARYRPIHGASGNMEDHKGVRGRR
jgi:hypothetical protein